jgi:chemotaxis signal transduction protein
MNTLSSDIQNRLLRLKETFDRAIAKPIASKPGNRTQYLVFKLEQEYFAWPAADLEEIILNRRIVALPCRQERSYGIVNYKNDVLPVINLHSHLNFASEKPQKGRILLITRGLATDTAVLVNDLVTLVPVANNRIRPKPISIKPEITHKISGEFYHEGQMVTLLNPAAFSLEISCQEPGRQANQVP